MGISENLARLNADAFAIFGSMDENLRRWPYCRCTISGTRKAGSLDADEMASRTGSLTYPVRFTVVFCVTGCNPAAICLEWAARLKHARRSALMTNWGDRIAQGL